MIVTYKSHRLEKVCCDDSEMQKAYSDIAKRLRKRINALLTFTTLGELKSSDLSGRWHPLQGQKKGERHKWAGSVSGNYRIIIQPVQCESELACTCVEILSIEDYH